MAVNKVVYNNNILIDLTADTVTAETLAEGVTAHDASGASILGTLVAGGNIQSGTVTGNGSTVMNITCTGTLSNVVVYRTTNVSDLTASSYYLFVSINGYGFAERYSHSSATWGSYTPSTTQNPVATFTNGNIKCATNAYVFDSGAEYKWIGW